MKKNFMYFIVLFGIVFSANVFARCFNDYNSKVSEIYGMKDYIVIKFDKDTYCSCPIKDRMAYKIEYGEDFITTAAILALTDDRKVIARQARNDYCSLEGIPILDLFKVGEK